MLREDGCGGLMEEDREGDLGCGGMIQCMRENLQRNEMPTLEQLTADEVLLNREGWKKRLARLIEI